MKKPRIFKISVYLHIPEKKLSALLTQVKLHVNNRDISFPHQLFIDNEFVDASSGATYNTINPTDESVNTNTF